MTASLTDRLNQILPRITDKAFLSGDGIGNEIACHIFDYPADQELTIRAHLKMVEARLATHHGALDVLHLDLLDVMVDYLRERKLLDKALEMQRPKGDAAVIKALKGPLTAERLTAYISTTHKPANRDLILISGVGSVWPLVRAHSLLNCLHPVIGRTPLVMFYPGSYDGTTLRLFGRITPDASKPSATPYYRAFFLTSGVMTP